jgi:hypothetical protein
VVKLGIGRCYAGARARVNGSDGRKKIEKPSNRPRRGPTRRACLGFDLLGIRRPVKGTPIDRQGEIERDGKKPGEVRQGYPDLVMVHSDPKRRRRGLVIAIEAQKDYDADKRWMIPVYQSKLAEKHRLQTWVVVVSLSKQMSRSLRAWREGEPPRVDVLLIDADSVPKSPWLDDPARRPTAAVLVGALHGYAGDLDASRLSCGPFHGRPARTAPWYDGPGCAT